MASSFKVGIKEGTKFLYATENQCNAPCRLYEKTDKKTGKTYYEGALELNNGQYVWVSLGGKLNENETNKGTKYLTAKVKFTSGEGKTSRTFYK